MTGDFDLLGDPIPENRASAAVRRTHRPRKTAINSDFWWLWGEHTRIVRVLRFTGAKRRKYYFRQHRQLDEARQRCRKIGGLHCRMCASEPTHVILA